MEEKMKGKRVPFLEIRNLNKSFGQIKVLKDINFTMEESEILVIVGPSGGGKSTLLRCLNGLEEPDTGGIYLRGIEEEPKNIFGLVFQQFNLFPQYTALDNVTLAPKIRGEEAIENIQLRAKRLLIDFGLAEEVEKYPHQLSGGQKQRVALARAMILNPAVLCLDEPTSALDPYLRDVVADLILELKREGMTLIVVTHDFQFAKKIADKTLFMDGGILKNNEEMGV